MPPLGSMFGEHAMSNENPDESDFESKLTQVFERICRHAQEMIGVDHSGFVRFDDRNEVGRVVAQYPYKDRLIGREVRLTGVPAEEDFLDSEEPLVIEDVAASQRLGEVKDLLQEFGIRSICI